MDDLFDKLLLDMLRANRRRHGKAWAKVRRDRIEKLFPEFVERPGVVEEIVEACLKEGAIKACFIQDGATLIPAVRLSFSYWRSHR
jgi:hypothetical protein